MEAEGLVAVELTDDERRVLIAGLNEWGGPARPTQEMARAMGFDDLDDLFARRTTLRAAIESGQPLSPPDWCRALLATEIVFISDLVGSGHDWMFTTGMSDADTVDHLRRLQIKLMPTVSGVIGHAFGTLK